MSISSVFGNPFRNSSQSLATRILVAGVATTATRALGRQAEDKIDSVSNERVNLAGLVYRKESAKEEVQFWRWYSLVNLGMTMGYGAIETAIAKRASSANQTAKRLIDIFQLSSLGSGAIATYSIYPTIQHHRRANEALALSRSA